MLKKSLKKLECLKCPLTLLINLFVYPLQNNILVSISASISMFECSSKCFCVSLPLSVYFIVTVCLYANAYIKFIYVCLHVYHYTCVHVFYSKKAAQNNDQDRKPLAEFLEPHSLSIYPLIVGKLPLLSKLPPRTDIHEWLATNCKCRTVLYFCVYM